MVANVEVDRLGRFVIPKKMRDALHLQAGEKLEVRCDGEQLVMSRERSGRGLYMKDGWLVYDAGGQRFSEDDARRWIEDERKERTEPVSGRER